MSQKGVKCTKNHQNGVKMDEMLRKLLEQVEAGACEAYLCEKDEKEFFVVDNGQNDIGIITRDTDNGETIIYQVKATQIVYMMDEQWEVINNALDKADPNIDYGKGIVS